MKIDTLILLAYSLNAAAANDGGVADAMKATGANAQTSATITCPKQNSNCLYVIVTGRQKTNVIPGARAKLDGKKMTTVGECLIACGDVPSDDSAVQCEADLYQSRTKRVPDPKDTYLNYLTPLTCELDPKKGIAAFFDNSGNPKDARGLPEGEQKKYIEAIAREWSGSPATLFAISESTGFRVGAIVVKSQHASAKKWAETVANEVVLEKALKKFSNRDWVAPTSVDSPGFQTWLGAQPNDEFRELRTSFKQDNLADLQKNGTDYIGHVANSIQASYYALSTKAPRMPDYKSLSIALKIAPNGQLLVARITESSGSTSWDELALLSATKAAPFGPPPDAVRERLKTQGVTISLPYYK